MGASDETDRTASPADREVAAAEDEADELALPVDEAALDTADTPVVPAEPVSPSPWTTAGMRSLHEVPKLEPHLFLRA